ncbi:Arc family DNA-binding protein [Rhodovulum sp. MB263]|uniref:Arc family DNA-binding protein n=1 Tax=Rhodovulum sp. (strain MB263) TaxID=308754 RepID=UPI0009B7D12B|nr:Arc family DNA-binding protein [Rhodovulum sp. MB263]ARC90227.1 hypothetical protein B5V46_17245 [Rhodovulum sp. MB263]
MTDSTPKQEPPYGLRMPPDLKARVKASAEANNRSMNAEIVSTLEEKYPAPIDPRFKRLIELVNAVNEAFANETDRENPSARTIEAVQKFVDATEIFDLDDIDVQVTEGGEAQLRFRLKKDQ